MAREKASRLPPHWFSKKTFAVVVASFISIATTARAVEPTPTKLLLHDGWAIQSSCEVKAGGQEVSTGGFPTKGWHRAEVPTTVVGALVADKTYPDPFFGMNLKSLPTASGSWLP